MRNLWLCLALTVLPLIALSQESDFDNIFLPPKVSCGDSVEYRVTVVNIDVVTTPTALTNTSVLIEVLDGSDVIYSHTEPGPDIAPGAFHVYEIVVRGDDIGANGSYNVRFTFQAAVDVTADPVSPEFPLTVDKCPMTIEEARARLAERMQAMPELGDNRVGFLFPELLDAGVMIESTDPSEFSMELANPRYFGMVLTGMDLIWQQPMKYMVLDPVTSFVQTFDATWCPMIDDSIWNPLQQGEILLEPYDFDANTTQYTYLFESVIPTGNPRECALIMVGDGGSPEYDETYANTGKLMRDHLISNRYGPRLTSTQVVILDKITGDSLLNRLEGMKGLYDKIHFYYAGNGYDNGLAPITTSSVGLPYSDLFTALYDTRANDFCIVIDAPKSGRAIEEAEDNLITCHTNINIVTAADDLSNCVYPYFDINSEGQRVGHFSASLIKCMNDRNADVNGDSTVTLAEGYEWMQATNPETPLYGGIFDYQNPQILEYKFDPDFVATQVLNTLQEELEPAEFDSAAAYMAFERFFGGFLSGYTGGWELPVNSDESWGWFDSNPRGFFPKDIGVFTWRFNPGCADIKVTRTPLSNETWPDNSATFNYGNMIKAPPVVTTSEVLPIDQAPPAQLEGVCALLVSGYDPRTDVQKIFETSVKHVSDKLRNERDSEYLPNEDVFELFNISTDSLYNIMRSMRGQYDTIYFYFIGHSNSDGNILLGEGSSTNYKDLMDSLATIDAGEYRMIFDSGASGVAISKFQNTLLIDKRVDLHVSNSLLGPDGPDPGDYKFYEGATNGIATFTKQLMECYTAEADDIEGSDDNDYLTFAEAKQWLTEKHLMDGELITVLPQSILHTGQVYEGTDPINVQFSGAGVWLDLQPGLGLNRYGITQRQQGSAEQTTDDTNVYGIGPMRKIILSSERNRSAEPLRGDLTWDYLSAVDTIPGEDGVLGLVYRFDREDEWRAVYPIEYDAEENSVVVRDIPVEGQYRFALIKDSTSALLQLSPDVAIINLRPNPVNEVLSISLDLQVDLVMTLEIVDLNGRVISHIEAGKRIPGSYVEQFDLRTLVPGYYFARIISDKGTRALPFIKIE